MLNFLYKHCGNDLKGSSLSLNKSLNLVVSNVKLVAAHLVRLILADKEIKEALTHNKVYELFFTLLNDSNLGVRFFALECFNEFSMTSQTSNKIMRDLTRADFESKEFFLCFIKKTPFNASLSDADILASRAIDHVRSLREFYQKSGEENASINLDELIDQHLDDTMNVLMSMDTTVADKNGDNDDDADLELLSSSYENDISKRNEASSLMANMNADFEKLKELYASTTNSQSKAWIKQELGNACRKFQDFL